MSQLDPKRRVVVTGLGVVSSIGIGWEEFWKNLLAGKSGISRISRFDTTSFERHHAGEIKDFYAGRYVSSHRVNKIGRSSQFAIAASRLALEDAQLKNQSSRERVGIILGTTMGESRVLEYMDEILAVDRKDTIKSITPLSYPSNSILTNVACELNLTGANSLFANACAAGNYALGNAFDLVRTGRADVMLAGGVDSFSRVAFSGFGRLFAIAPEKCQPFDLNRQGIMVGEGAGVLVVEEYSNAVQRKAKIYAEILGYGLSCDAQHMTNPDPRSVEKAISKALFLSEVKPRDVGYISAHGTGTVENDKAECEAINRIFGHLDKKPPVSSIKSMLGHTMGAASAIESVACCLAIKFSEIPPTINFENRDPFCDIDCVPAVSRKQLVNIAVNNSQAFGGNNACLIFKIAN